MATTTRIRPVSLEALTSTDVVLVNKERQTKVAVDVDLGKAATEAQRLNLAGPAAESITGQTLGDVPVGKDGAWNPQKYAVSVSGTHLSVALPPLSATLIHSL